MTSPHTALLQHYGTAGVFEKKADGMSLLERLAGGVAGFTLGKNQTRVQAEQRAQAAQMNEMLRELELAQVDRAGQLLRHTPVPRFAPSYIPPGWDEGMVRTAAIAAQVGADMAKEAGLGGFVDFMKGVAPAMKSPAAAGGLLDKSKALLNGKLGLGWKGNLALAGAAAGGLALGNRGINKTTQAMGAESEGPATYGGGRHGAQLSYGVNQYGQPQLGTPL